MKKLALVAAVFAGLSAPSIAEACTATGYVITVIVPGTFPNPGAAIFVRHPTSTGGVTSATSTNLAVVEAAANAVTGEQRVVMEASGGGNGVCPAVHVGTVTSLALRP